MKKTLVALAAAAAISPAAFAGDISWKGDANVEGFMYDQDEMEKVAGYSSRIRLAGSAKTDGNVSVNFRLLLNNSTWSGDDHATVQGAYELTGSDPVAVDYGYIQMPVAGWTVRVGRQVANWAGCFITCNENRDRLLAMKRFGSTTLVLINDKRIEGDIAVEDDESDMYAVAGIGMYKGWLWGALLATWQGDLQGKLNGNVLFSPYIKGKAAGLEIEGGFAYLGGADEGSLYDGDTYQDAGSGLSGFVRLGKDFGQVKLEGVAVMTKSGGLIDTGFNFYSMTLNNNPKAGASNVNYMAQNGYSGALGAFSGPIGRNLGTGIAYAGTLGGEIAAGADGEYVLAAKVSGKVAEGLTLSGAAGIANQDAGYDVETDYTFINVQASYQLAKTTEVYAGVESLSVENDALNQERDAVAGTVGVNTTF